MRWMARAAVLLLCLGIAAVIGFRYLASRGPQPIEAPPLAARVTVEGENGLPAAERGRYYHLSEGGEIFPLDWALALETVVDTRDGRPVVRPFLDNIERYGMLPDPKGPGNPFGLPVGVSVAPSAISGVMMIGLNCTACHVGQIEYEGHGMRMDGGPSMALINAFLRDLAVETQRTIENPTRLARFVDRVHAVRRDRHAADPAPGEQRSWWERLKQMGGAERGLLESRLAVLRRVPSLKRSLLISTQEGYGRLDAFGIGRDELFGALGENMMPANAPVSLPHIWGMQVTGWLQWGANTNSVMERNIGQALGVGALFDPTTYRSTVRLDDLHAMEEMAYRLRAPEWPSFLPAIDQPRAARGGELFVKYCAGCHETWTTDGRMRIYKQFSLAEAGTDPMTAISFELPVRQPDGQVRPFPYAAMDLIKRIKQQAYEARGLDQAAIDRMESRGIRAGQQWNPTFRAPLLDSEKWPETKGRKVYRSKTLVGIWATAPYLHNGSVPTIYDLLKPAAERPVTFALGTREYDPVKLGYQSDPSAWSLPQGAEPFTYDTRLPGNWNTGHEWSFYPQLTDEMRYDIIEFLKTFTTDLSPAPPATYPTAASPIGG